MKILSLAPSNTEILFALGLGGSLLAVTEYCDYPPGALSLPRLRGWVSMDEEEIAGLKAQLVVTSTVCQEKLRRRLEAAGTALLHLDPRTLSQVGESLMELGRKTGREAEAQRLVEGLEGERAALRSRVPSGAKRPRLYCEEWQKPPAVSGNWFPELMGEAGAGYFPIAPGELSRRVGPGEVEAFNPEIILLSVCGMGLKADPGEVLARPGWEGLEAVRKGRVFTLEDSLLSRPGPRLVQGADLVQALLGECFWGWPSIRHPAVRRLPDGRV